MKRKSSSPDLNQSLSFKTDQRIQTKLQDEQSIEDQQEKEGNQVYQNELDRMEYDISCEENWQTDQFISELENMHVNEDSDEAEPYFNSNETNYEEDNDENSDTDDEINADLDSMTPEIFRLINLQQRTIKRLRARTQRLKTNWSKRRINSKN